MSTLAFNKVSGIFLYFKISHELCLRIKSIFFFKIYNKPSLFLNYIPFVIQSKLLGKIFDLCMKFLFGFHFMFRSQIVLNINAVWYSGF